jgi:hypothetical protein
MNNFFDLVTQLQQELKDERFDEGQITLGELISKLETLPEGNIVVIDYTQTSPTCADSYRGYYEELSFEYGDSNTLTVKEFLVICENAVGKTFTGYRGGDFTMRRYTPVWIARYGESGKMITGVSQIESTVVLITSED